MGNVTGVAPGRGQRRVVLDDPRVSRDQLRICSLSDGRVEVVNLSPHIPIDCSDGSRLAGGAVGRFELPLRLIVGATSIEITSASPSLPEPMARDDDIDSDSQATVFPGRPLQAGPTVPIPDVRQDPTTPLEHTRLPRGEGWSDADDSGELAAASDSDSQPTGAGLEFDRDAEQYRPPPMAGGSRSADEVAARPAEEAGPSKKPSHG